MPRVVGDWTRDKLKVLEDYLPWYLQATTTAIDRIYVDAFAGPGKNILRRSRQVIDGSPLIALKAAGTNGTRFSRLYFIENDANSAQELRTHLDGLDSENRCQVILGDVNQELPKLIRRLHMRAPTFVLLDTQGIDPRWVTIEAVASWRVEFLINFPLGMSINRNPDSQKTVEYFGTRDCLPLLRRKGTGRTRALLDLYKGRLESLGFTHTTDDDRLVKTLNASGSITWSSQASTTLVDQS
jgi:three-Cys-motif partner protein